MRHSRRDTSGTDDRCHVPTASAPPARSQDHRRLPYADSDPADRLWALWPQRGRRGYLRRRSEPCEPSECLVQGACHWNAVAAQHSSESGLQDRHLSRARNPTRACRSVTAQRPLTGWAHQRRPLSRPGRRTTAPVRSRLVGGRRSPTRTPVLVCRGDGRRRRGIDVNVLTVTTRNKPDGHSGQRGPFGSYSAPIGAR